MNVALRIMVTADQKRLLDDAAKIQEGETSTWARHVLLEAARRITVKGSTDKTKGG